MYSTRDIIKGGTMDKTMSNMAMRKTRGTSRAVTHRFVLILGQLSHCFASMLLLLSPERAAYKESIEKRIFS